MRLRLPKTFFGLSFFFSVIIFCAMFCTVAVSAVVAFFVVRSDIVPTTAEMVPIIWTTCAIVAGLSFPIGALVAVLASKVPLRPIREMMDGMDKLAGGDFHTRISPGPIMSTYPHFVELTDSFNKMAQQLDHTEMLRSDFINNFSHEFKTPIVSIAGFARLLRRGNVSPEQQAEYLAIIEEESLRLSSMATNVLHLTKLENQTILTDVTTYNLSEQLRSCVLLLADEWTHKGLEPDLEFDEFFISANEELMKQVFINLLDNAIKFSPQGGRLGVELEQTTHWTRVRVSNQGDPIPEESREKIFYKFYQVDESHAAKGNGIGLAIVKQVVKLHKGNVSFSCADGINCFTVLIPNRQKEVIT